jgi:hypothetical protein
MILRERKRQVGVWDLCLQAPTVRFALSDLPRSQAEPFMGRGVATAFFFGFGLIACVLSDTLYSNGAISGADQMMES